MATGLKGQLSSWRTSSACLQVLVENSGQPPTSPGQTAPPDMSLGWRGPLSVSAAHVLHGQMGEGAASPGLCRRMEDRASSQSCGGPGCAGRPGVPEKYSAFRSCRL